MEVRKAESPVANKLDELYEVSDADTALAVIRQPSEEANRVEIPAPLTDLDQLYLGGSAARPLSSISRYITPLDDDNAQPTFDPLHVSIENVAPLRNPEMERVASVPLVEPTQSSEYVDTLLEPETIYFEADDSFSPTNLDSQPVMKESMTTERASNGLEADDWTITLVPRSDRDVWTSESASDSSSAPLHSLYDPASGFSGGPASLTASAFANVSSTPRQSTKSPSSLTTPRPYLGSLISRPEDATYVPNSKAQAPATLTYPQWVDQADTDVQTRQSASGPSQQLINPTAYRQDTAVQK
jgi:hypothetical protein